MHIKDMLNTERSKKHCSSTPETSLVKNQNFLIYYLARFNKRLWQNLGL